MFKNKLFGISVIIAAIAIFLAVYTGLRWFSTDISSPLDNGGRNPAFPPALGDMQLAEVVSGLEAVSMIGNLHGTEIEIAEGYILTYAGLEGQVTIWISKSNTESEARRLFQVMDGKIRQTDKDGAGLQSTGGPPFYNRRTLNQNGIDVIAVEGMGMENYYYLIGREVYWIAVAGPAPRQVLKEVLALSKLPG